MMDKNHFLLLVTKVLSGNATPDDEELLRTTLADQPELLPLYEQYSRYWKAPAHQQAANVEKALSATWQKIQVAETNEASPVRKLFTFKRIAVAAVLLGMVSMVSWFVLHKREEAADWMVAYNPKGIRSSIVLPDGSKVWLAADSRLKYPRHFAADKRDLFLEGEAFFEVTRNPQKPFEVHLKEGSVRVLGTSFDIKAYNEQASVITSVATGKVAFMPAHSADLDTVLLTPGKKSVFDMTTRTTKVLETDAAIDKAWIDGVLQFEAEPLGSIALSLERYYGKTVVFKDARLKELKYTGKFANSSAAEVLQFLSRTRSFVFAISDSMIVIGK